MITIKVHGNGDGIRGELPVARLEELLRREDTITWIDVESPSPADLQRLGDAVHLHPLAREDAERFRQRPKLDHYDTYLVIVFFALSWPEEAGLQTHEIHLIVGGNFLVTIHHGPLPAIAATAGRWCRQKGRGGSRVGFLVYDLLDAIVDEYFPVIDTLADRIDALESAVFATGEPRVQAAIFALKKDLLMLRRVVAPERDVLNAILRRDTPHFGDREIVYLQDVYDHLLRVTDAIDLYRDLLSSALDASLSLTGNKLNQIMRTLTASSIILMSMTVVASVYGMNFDFMPELDWTLGYPFALGLMLAVGGSLLLVFRRSGWL
ncbi:MAG: magnesium/cobalt transporter CorA [Chloroflexota bacterium]|nr:magnesium/cobalt transporter CorA [Chloroflexota bacterium]